MRLTLWQQFSSNHSADFTVVGTFESRDAAQKAGDELQDILHRIEVGRDGFDVEPSRELGHRVIESTNLTKIEKQLSKDYEVDWPFTLAAYFNKWYPWENAVQVFDKMIFVNTPPVQILFCPQPFEQLMTRLGGQAAVQVSESQTYPDTALLLDIICTLHDEAAAQALYERFSKAFKAMLAAIRDDYENYDFEAIKTLEFEFNYDRIDDRFEPPERIYEVESVGNELRLYGLNIVERYGLPEALEHFLAYLHGLGCTDIQYRFHSALVPRKRASEGDE
jgi:hypothetical protein